ncbi:Hypothetical predicted protein [Paramuricea clavata]|uniref:Uncharacterized protein n=1 Tax=Paramuricea clavata TaxID=317549 RepID=A0A6S7GP41_PARCT|nr:Hypothetical predicted protein [Paramuricea clavata]
MVAKLSVQEVIHDIFEDYDSQNMPKNHETNSEEYGKEEQCLVEPGISRLLYGRSINAGVVYNQESLLWLEAIFRRLPSRRLFEGLITLRLDVIYPWKCLLSSPERRKRLKVLCLVNQGVM